MKKSQLRKIIREIIEEQSSAEDSAISSGGVYGNYITSIEGEQLPLCVDYDNFIFGAVETASGFSHSTLLVAYNNLYINSDVFNDYSQDQISATTACCSLLPGVTFTPEQSAPIPAGSPEGDPSASIPDAVASMVSPSTTPQQSPNLSHININTKGAPQPSNFKGGASGKDYIRSKNTFIKKTMRENKTNLLKRCEISYKLNKPSKTRIILNLIRLLIVGNSYNKEQTNY